MSAQAKRLPCEDQLAGIAFGEIESRRLSLDHCNRQLAGQSAEERVRWSLANLPQQHVSQAVPGRWVVARHHLRALHCPQFCQGLRQGRRQKRPAKRNTGAVQKVATRDVAVHSQLPIFAFHYS